MALMELVFKALQGQHTMIGALQLDALVSEQTELSSSVTRYAVEQGAPISDHITAEAETLTLEGVITGARVQLFGTYGRSKLIEAKEALRTIHEQRQPLTVITGMDVYPDFALESCTISRSADKGEQFSVSLGLVKIRKAQTRETDIPPGKVKPKAQGKAGETKKPAGRVSDKSRHPKTQPSAAAQQKAQKVAQKPAPTAQPKQQAQNKPLKSKLKNNTDSVKKVVDGIFSGK